EAGWRHDRIHAGARRTCLDQRGVCACVEFVQGRSGRAVEGSLSMRRHPIVQALLAGKLTTAMLVLELALTFAVAANVLSVVASSCSLMSEPGGIGEGVVGIAELEAFGTGRQGVTPGEAVPQARSVDGLAAAAWVRALQICSDLV